MATSLAIPSTLIGSEIERALIDGDLKQLTPNERINYYRAICESLSLNPLTKPFGYIVLNGKLQLYALKDCTEQLRRIHKVSITSVVPQQIGELLVVVAAGTDGTGRTDSATGAVSTANLKGEALANAMMKCETKAKRRLTLSLCGLGMLDETEVDTLKQQGVAREEAAQPDPRPTQPASGVANSTPVAGTSAQSSPSSASGAAQSTAAVANTANDGPFKLMGTALRCVATDVKDGGKPEKLLVKVYINGVIDGASFASCFDTKYFDVLRAAKGQEVIMELRQSADKKYLNVVSVKSVGGQPVGEDGKIIQEEA